MRMARLIDALDLAGMAGLDHGAHLAKVAI